jgi:histidine triad (HIT) family protein
MNCIFCKIANKEIKSSVVFETKNVLAFDDINPQAPVHVVVIPKAHMLEIEELGAILPELFVVIGEVSEKKKIKGSGFRVVMNNGPDAGQAVPHLHFHVLGGRKLAWPPG